MRISRRRLPASSFFTAAVATTPDAGAAWPAFRRLRKRKEKREAGLAALARFGLLTAEETRSLRARRLLGGGLRGAAGGSNKLVLDGRRHRLHLRRGRRIERPVGIKIGFVPELGPNSAALRTPVKSPVC